MNLTEDKTLALALFSLSSKILGLNPENLKSHLENSGVKLDWNVFDLFQESSKISQVEAKMSTIGTEVPTSESNKPAQKTKEEPAPQPAAAEIDFSDFF